VSIGKDGGNSDVLAEVVGGGEELKNGSENETRSNKNM